MSSELFLLLGVFAFFVLSQEQECSCEENLCSAVRSHEYVFKGKVERVKEKNGEYQYKVKISKEYKEEVSKTINIWADMEDECLEKLQEEKNYLLFANLQDDRYMLSSCFNQKFGKLSNEEKDMVEKCTEECPPVCEIYCPYGMVKDEYYCDTCSCNPPPSCPWGNEPYECGEDPCQENQWMCPGAFCTVDKCQSCDPLFFDVIGRSICEDCEKIDCDLECEMYEPHPVTGCATCACHDASCPLLVCEEDCPYGFVRDAQDCNTCQCWPCPGGENEVQCFVEPCSFMESQCPDASSCLNNYCGGCYAHYFNEDGAAVCLEESSCPNNKCPTECRFGYENDMNGCPTCTCKEQPVCEVGEPTPCFADPCMNAEQDCPGADRCVTNYCGGCFAEYLTSEGFPYFCNPEECEEVMCEIECPYGFEADEEGCKTCECMEEPLCADGTEPFPCFIDPCINQEVECPQATLCVAGYCGGCWAHFFDSQGTEICNDCNNIDECLLFCEYGYARNPDTGCLECECVPGHCEDLECALWCEYGFLLDEEGCEICECKEPDTCEDGTIPIACFPDPCDVEPPCEEANKCKVDRCNVCGTIWLDIAGQVVTC